MPFVVGIVSLAWLSLVGAAAMAVVALVALAAPNESGMSSSFFGSALVVAFAGGIILFAFRGVPLRSGRRELVLTPVVCWVVTPAIFSVPLLLAMPDLSVTNAYFETVSGLTTTGATILESHDSAPRTLLFWRALLQWLGGFATLAMVIALFPLLNIGGMNLFFSQLPHGEGETIGDRVRGVVRSLWTVYGALTGACVALLWLAGAPSFDAVCLGFSTLSTGGFMVRDGGIAVYGNPVMEIILIVFMLVGAVNFSLHWALLHNRRARYRTDPEVRRLIRVGVGASLLMTVMLAAGSGLPVIESARRGVFDAVSMLTTTGFLSGVEASFPLSPALLILPLVFLGGSTGSTAGGLKMMRVRMLFKHSSREFARLLRPHGVVRKSYGGRTMSDQVMAAAWAFLIVFILAICGFTLLLAMTGLELHAAVSASTATLTNTGSALTLIAADAGGYDELPAASRWLLSMAMIMGRLEVLPALILLSPMFWRS